MCLLKEWKNDVSCVLLNDLEEKVMSGGDPNLLLHTCDGVGVSIQGMKH